jgi:hypothetical protein
MFFFRSREQVKISCSHDSREDIPVMWHFSLLWNPYQNRPVCWSIVVKEKQTLGSPFFFGNFRSDQILKETKDTNIHFFIHSSNSQKSYQGIPENYTSELWKLFEVSTYYILYLTQRLHLSPCFLSGLLTFLYIWHQSEETGLLVCDAVLLDVYRYCVHHLREFIHYVDIMQLNILLYSSML